VSAVYGPPWQTVDDPKQLLQLDPPVLTACNALAAVAPRHGVLVRLDNRSAVERAALVLSRDTGDPVAIFRGAIQTRSGGWLWPSQVDVVDVHKAEDDDPTTRDGFVGTVEELLDELMAMADEAEAVAFGAASGELSFDYAQATADEVEGSIARAAAIIAALPVGTAFAAAASTALARITQRVAEVSALSVPGLIGFGLTADQTELARRLGSDAMVFVTDEFRRRAGRMSADARGIIANGVSRGLGRQDIGRNLNQALGHRLSGRDEWYFRVVASSAVSRSRSFGQMVGYRGAGIDYYMWYALMDERTCEICRFLHGQQFPVASPLQAFNRAFRNPDPEAAVNEFPWYRVVGGERVEGGLRRGGDIHVQPRGQPLGTLVASVRESGVGQRDVAGTHRVHTSPGAAGGTTVPPAHGMCRCTTIPV
jgi:SPP1 gp7 family putative phage head morphogenesis protein